jgi:hypothetical protein
MPRFPVCSTTFNLWRNFVVISHFPVRAALPLHLITLHFIILREFHNLWGSSLHNLFFLPPPQHPVCGKVSHCYRTIDNMRNECLKKNRIVRGETLHSLQVKENLTEMKVTKQCPLVFLVNVSCRQVGTLQIEVVEVMGSGMSWVRSRRNMLRSHRTWGLNCRV